MTSMPGLYEATTHASEATTYVSEATTHVSEESGWPPSPGPYGDKYQAWTFVKLESLWSYRERIRKLKKKNGHRKLKFSFQIQL